MRKIKNFNRVAETKFALSIDSINLLYYTLPKHFSDEYRSYDCPRLCTILEGEKEVNINQSEKFTYNKEKYILLPADSKVHMFIPTNTRALVYEFGDEIIENVSQKVSDDLETDVSGHSHSVQCFSGQPTNRLSILHSRVQDIVTCNEANLEFLVDLTCQEIIYELLKNEVSSTLLHHHGNHPINRAIRMMNSSDGYHMTISQLAEETGMTLSGFSQKFKQITNYSPQEYLTKQRLLISKHYLKHLSVTETAYEVGYDSISHYIKLFKKEFGITPKQYQLTNQSTG